MDQDDTLTRMHHVAVQTSDLDNCTAWYRDFFGCRPTWSTDTFSELTLSRLPGMARMTEVALGTTRFHLFECTGSGDRPPQAGPAPRFQHVCMTASTPAALRAWREKWLALHASGRYTFRSPDLPSPIVVDDRGVESFYFLDVNGLEFEFTYEPAAAGAATTAADPAADAPDGEREGPR